MTWSDWSGVPQLHREMGFVLLGKLVYGKLVVLRSFLLNFERSN